ncbi:hypothetical protein IJ182_04170 [bacterium]|nr:hypothetical protein [bacterium]
MRVSFNPVINNKTSFGISYYAHDLPPKEPTKDEIQTAKIKKVVSELKYVAIGVGIVYFGVKKAFNDAKIKEAEERLANKLKDKAPEVCNLFKNRN